MAKFTHITNSFKAGQLGEKLVGRTDIEEYRSGCLELKNMVISPTGGAFRRGGLTFFTSLPPEGAEDCIIIPLILSNEVSYLIQFSRDADGDVIRGVDSNGTSLSGFEPTLGFSLPDDLSKLRWAQFGRFLFVTSATGDMPPIVIFVETGLFNVLFVEPFDETELGGANSPRPFRSPYQSILDGSTLTYTRDAGGDTVEIAPVGTYFTANSVGGYIRLLQGSTEHIVKITGFVSNYEVEVEWESPEGLNTRPTSGTAIDWGRSQWAPDKGYPQCVTVFQNRLVFATTFDDPTTIWASAVGNPFIMMQQKLFQDESTDTSEFNYFGELDDLQAFDFPISSSRATSVTWLGSQRSLHVGTDNVEYALASDTGGFGALSFPNLRPQTFHGGRNIQPERIGRYSVFIAEDGKTVRDFAYSENNGSHASRDLSILSPDIIFDNLRGGDYAGTSYKQMAWQESNRTLWCLSDKGALVSFSFDENSDLKAWAHHEVGDNLEILSIAVIPIDGESTLIAAGIPNIGGSDFILLYRLEKPIEDPLFSGSTSRVNYFDGGAYYKYGTKTDTHAANWLQGREIFALADGEIEGPLTVDGSGDFTTSKEVSEISFGFRYTHKLVTMPLEAGTIIGSAQGQLKRVDRMFLDLYKSQGTEISYGDTKYPIEYPPTPAFTSFTGRVKYDYDSTPEERYFVTLEGDDPLPFGVLNITFRGVTQD